MIYNRKTKEYFEEKEYGKNKLEFLYNTAPGRLLLKIAISPLFSKIYGLYKKSHLSKKQIEKFKKEYNIEAGTQSFESFNEFFTRKKSVSFNTGKNELSSPCDGKVLIYKITNDNMIKIKDTDYSLFELLKSCMNYGWDTCVVIRLAMTDVHRYYFIDDGKVYDYKKIRGQLHTVRSISDKYEVYKENKREWTILQTQNFGMVLQMEVGAMFVGDIVNYIKPTFKKGEEKGYFNIGGSTIVLLTGGVVYDEDIVENSQKGIETLIECGEKIGRKENNIW